MDCHSMELAYHQEKCLHSLQPMKAVRNKSTLIKEDLKRIWRESILRAARVIAQKRRLEELSETKDIYRLQSLK